MVKIDEFAVESVGSSPHLLHVGNI
jgi:hypothetical protein